VTDRRAAAHPGAVYHERLWPPPAWWLVTTALVASLAVAVGYPLGRPAGIATFVLCEVLAGWALMSAAARVQVTDRVLVAGRARLPLTVVSAVTALDPEQAAALRGRQADARAFMLLRPWLRAAVRVDLDDPADRTPYWYVSTRHPAALAAAAARGACADVADGPDGAG
jgi:hypothetical protein